MTRLNIPTRFNADNSKAVQATNVIGSNVVIFTAWERTRFTSGDGGHTTVSSLGFSNGIYGAVTARNLGSEFDTIPVGEFRFNKVREFRVKRNADAIAVVYELFPELKGIGVEVDGGVNALIDDVGDLIATVHMTTH